MQRQSPTWLGNRLLRLTTAAWLLMLGGCATWQAPPTPDDNALRSRAVTTSLGDVRLSAAVLSAEDSRRWFGHDVHAVDVQPVWVEVENRGPDALWLLRSGTDPEYFSPLEVAWSFHAPLSGARNTAIDEHFAALDFANPILPGTTQAGIIFTNRHRRTRVLNVDLLGNRRLLPFTLFLPIPDDPPDYEAKQILARHDEAQKHDIQDLDALRKALKALPCCGEGADGDPVNLIIVSTLDDIGAAVARRGFRSDRRPVDDAQRVFGRPPDVVGRKLGPAGLPAHWIRLWIAPLTYRGQTIFAAQVGRPIGGRGVDPDAPPTLHPAVDELRNLLIQEAMYAGALARLGFVEGGATGGDRFYSDGLRAVLFFVTRPRALSDLETIDWVPYLERRTNEAAGRAE